MPTRPLHVFNPGDRVGSWAIRAYLKGGRYAADCDCGKSGTPLGRNLASGVSRSCGCERTNHGLSQRREYAAYYAMIRRCTKSSDPGWKNYGGRGISVHDTWVTGAFVDGKWRTGFQLFYAHIGPRPTEKHSLGRIDNEGSYVPDNVAWQTTGEQSRNKRSTRLITFAGRTQCLADWEKEIQGENVVASRLANGWTLEQALTVPRRKGGLSVREVMGTYAHAGRVYELEATVAAKDAEITELKAANAELKATIARLTAGQ